MGNITNAQSDGNVSTSYLNGIKGVACLIVALMHFINTFYPAVFNGEGVFASHLPWAIDAHITQTPLMSLINGRLMVGVFMVISGMVITMQVMRCSDRRKLAQIVSKRYFRFTITLFFFCALVFILRSLDLFYAEKLVEITDARGQKGVYSQELNIYIYIYICVLQNTFSEEYGVFTGFLVHKGHDRWFVRGGAVRHSGAEFTQKDIASGFHALFCSGIPEPMDIRICSGKYSGICFRA